LKGFQGNTLKNALAGYGISALQEATKRSARCTSEAALAASNEAFAL
jgi:hypothetical protein